MQRIYAKSIASIIDSMIAKNPALADRLGQTRAIEAWNKIIGMSAAKFTKSLYIRKRVLYVKLTSSVLKRELMVCRESLIARLNEVAEHDVISDIVFL